MVIFVRSSDPRPVKRVAALFWLSPCAIIHWLQKFGIFHYKLLTMFQLDQKGICESCIRKPPDAEIIRCYSCQFYFHALCDSVDPGGTEYIAKKTHLNLHKGASTKPNFLWKCDKCLTIAEANEAASMREMMAKLITRFDELQAQVTDQIKLQVSQEFQKLTTSQTEEFSKLSDTIKVVEPVKSDLTVWNNVAKVEDMKSSLMIKPDKDGNPVDPAKVKQIVMNNGVQVNKVVVSSSGDTFINFPNQKSRDKLCPLLDNKNEIVMLKKKLPSVSVLGVTDELSRDDIKIGICSQNDVIGNLVNEGEELSVIFTRAPPAGKSYHQVTLRVSPKIRSAIKTSGNKIYLSDKVCNVVDNFHIKRCNRCQCYGHYASKCRPDTPEVCGYCGENHKSDNCLLKKNLSHTHKCINCQLAGLDGEGHSTFWVKCPAYIIQQDKLKSAIAYDYLN